MNLVVKCFCTKWSYLMAVLTLSLSEIPTLLAQPYPVTAIVQVTQFSPLPEAYDDPGRVVITLISTDTRPEYAAIMRLRLSGPGFSITTREEYLPAPLVLRRNQPLVLTGAQLRDYFDPLNLAFEGIEQSAILAGGGLLPEGPVSLCAAVYDYNRFFDPPVSNTGCANGFMQLHRPPVLIEPGAEVPVMPVQQLRFVWQAMHAGVNARYTLEIYENNLAGFSPDLVLQATPPLAVIQTLAPFYLYTNLDPLLLPGQDYLVRVRALDIMGQAAFLNEGWSEIYAFHYGIPCTPPVAPRLVTRTENSLQIHWETTGDDGHLLNGVALQSLSWHPEANSQAIQSIPVSAPEGEHTLTGLMAATGYTLTLNFICANGTPGAVPIYAHTLDSEPENCNDALPAQDFTASSVTDHRAELSWRSPEGINPETWYISHRKTNDPAFAASTSTQHSTFSLQGLAPLTEYEARVCYTCTAQQDRCDTLSFTTTGASCALAATEDYSYQCGDSTNFAPSGDMPLVNTLNPGDTVWAGDFLVILSEVSGVGTFRGTGYVSAPYFEEARLRLSFNNIRVNQHCRMVAGQMDVTGAGLAILDRINELIDQIMDQLDELDNILTQVEEMLGIAQEIVDALATIADYNQAQEDALAAIAEAATSFPFLPDSLGQNIQAALDCLNAAQDEAQFQICREQLATALAEYQAAVNALYQNAPFQVQFFKNPQQAYGFDEFTHEVHTDHYTHLNISNQAYPVPWKSAAASGTDRVNASAPQGLTGITFVNKNRALLPRTDSSGVATLTVTGGQYKGSAVVVYALHTGADSTDIHIAGQLHVAAYNEKPLKIVLVPVNGVTSPAGVAEALNQVFRQAVIRPEVGIHGGLQAPDFNGTLSDASSGMLANYNPDMRELIRAFERNTDPEPDTYYIFLVADCASADRLGFMPRGRKYGFVVVNNHTADQIPIARTIAHELAHGAYYLKHTFEQYPGLTSGSTDNLMDYASGIHLHKYQWDLIHEPDRDWGIFDGDEEAASETGVIVRNFIYGGNIYYEYTGSNTAYTCLTPAGELYAIPKNAVAAFHPAFNEWPAGSLVGYKIDQVTYYGWRKDGKFMGYAKAKDGVVSFGPDEYVASSAVNRDSVYAGLVDSVCRVGIFRGSMYAGAVYALENPLLPIEVLPIEHFVRIESALYLSLECLSDTALCRLQYADHPYLHPESNDPVSRYMKQHPCLIGTLTHFDFEPYNTQSEWMQGFNRVFGSLLAFAAAPVAAELLGPYLAQFGREKMAEAAVGLTADLLLQATIKYWFPPGTPITVLESFQGLDLYQAGASSIEAMISSSGWQGLIISASMSCAVDGFTQQGELRDSFALKNCLFGAGSALVIGTVLQSAPKFKDKLKTFAKPVLVRGLLRMLTEMPSFPPGRAWDFYRLIHPDRIQTEDVTTLFDITPEYASNIADNLHSSSALQNLFRDGDWWAEVRKFTDNPDLRGKLLDDLTENLNLAQAFKERPELVRAWEVALRQQAIRTNVGWLNRIEGWLAEGAPAVQVSKLVDEVEGYSSLKTAFEANKVNFFSWKRIDDGIPIFKAEDPHGYLTCLKKMTHYDNTASGDGTVKYYRVQGGNSGSASSRELIIAEPDGSLTFTDKDRELYISTDDMDHAIYFITGIGVNFNGDLITRNPPNRINGTIIEFEVPKWLDNQMKGEAIPQHRATLNSLSNNSPQIVDYTQPGHPFGIKKHWQTLIEQNYIQGSARTIE